MSDREFGLVELAMFFGVVLALAAWELVALARHRRREASKDGTRGIRNGNKD